MKKLIVIFLLLVTNYSLLNAQSGWFVQQSNVPLDLFDVRFVNSQTGFAVGDSGRVLKTTNGGELWTYQILSQYNTQPIKSVFFINQNTGWITGGNANGIFSSLGILKTTDAGISWYKLNSGGGGNAGHDIYFVNENTGFCGCGVYGNFITEGGAVLKTTNGGINWMGITSPIYSNFIFKQVSFYNSNTGWACGYYGDDVGHVKKVIIKTSNAGINWIEQYRDTLSSYEIYSLFVIDSIRVWCSTQNGMIVKTTNGGINWINQSSGTGRGLKSIFFINVNTGWTAGYQYPDSTNIMKTTNGGINWFNVRNTSANVLTSIWFNDALTGYAVGWKYPAAYGVILKTTTGGVTFTKEITQIIPQNFNLYQNYPNPFNPTTRIKFDIAAHSVGQTFLSVYDIAGRETQTLINEKLNPGTYEVTFDGSNVASGVYFYQMKVGEYVKTKKLVLLK